MSDTNSFLLRVKKHMEMEALSKLVPFMDFPNLPKDHSLNLEEYARVPGLLKSEVPLAPPTWLS